MPDPKPPAKMFSYAIIRLSTVSIHGWLKTYPEQFKRQVSDTAILGVDAQELEGMKDPDPYNPDPYAAVLSGKATLTCQEAAALLHKRPDYIRLGLQQGRPGFEFGSAVKVSGKWSYCIYANKFAEVTGIPVTAISGRDRG